MLPRPNKAKKACSHAFKASWQATEVRKAVPGSRFATCPFLSFLSTVSDPSNTVRRHLLVKKNSAHVILQ